MKKSYSSELLLLILSSLCGIIVSDGSWYFILIGGLFLALVSYFITPLLKRAAIEEYIEATKNTGKVKRW